MFFKEVANSGDRFPTAAPRKAEGKMLLSQRKAFGPMVTAVLLKGTASHVRYCEYPEKVFLSDTVVARRGLLWTRYKFSLKVDISSSVCTVMFLWCLTASNIVDNADQHDPTSVLADDTHDWRMDNQDNDDLVGEITDLRRSQSKELLTEPHGWLIGRWTLKQLLSSPADSKEEYFHL